MSRARFGLRHRGARTAGVAALALTTAVAGVRPHARTSAPVAVQILAFNDFHGNLDPPEGSNGRIGGAVSGGVEYLATHLASLRQRNPNTLVVSAGDNISASPLISGLFHDEPSIQALNAVGLDVSSVGNHEFDKGWAELRRMQRGGCHPTDGCIDARPFAGAHFQYLAANVRVDTGQVDPKALSASGWPDAPGETTLFPAYTIRTIGGVKIGFIGETLRDTAGVVLPSGIRGLTFVDEAAAANALVPEIERQGARTIVLLIHQGGAQGAGDTADGCSNFSGAILDVVNRLSPDIGVVVSGHTHRAYNCTIGDRLVTSAASFGRVVTDIDLEIDPASGQLVSKQARNVVVTRDVARDPAETAILTRYRPLYAGAAHRVIGAITSTIARRPNAAGESALGDLIADAQLETARRVAGADVAAAIMNDGGIRADLVAKGPGPTSAVTYEDLYTAQPFGNVLQVKTLTGDQIRRALEQQFAGPDRGLLQISATLTYRYDRSRPAGQRVDAASIRIGGQPLDPARSYRLAMNEFLAGGGDGFSVLAERPVESSCGADLDALVGYIGAHSPIASPQGGRISVPTVPDRARLPQRIASRSPSSP
jgi:5'-nucleotidase